MRNKELKLVITFHTTVDAIRMEKLTKEQNISGRMIPVPSSIKAGCGLAYLAMPEEKEALEKLMEENHLESEQIVKLMI